MNDLFEGLFFICLLMLLLGLINPKWALLWGKNKTRKKVALYLGSAVIIFFILFVMTSPGGNSIEEKSTSIQNKSEEVISTTQGVEEEDKISNENNEYSEKTVFSSDMTEDEFFSLLKKDDLYNECIEISNRVSEYKRNKKWIIETTEYLLGKCDKFWVEGGSMGGLKDLLYKLRTYEDSYNYSDEKHKYYEGNFKRIGGRLISLIYEKILRENLSKFSIFLPLNRDSLLDFLTQNQFYYVKDFIGKDLKSEEGWYGNYIEKIYSQSKEFHKPSFRVGWDKISGKLVSIDIPLGYNFEYDKIEQKDRDYENFINAFTKPYDFSMQVIEMFDDRDLKDYLYEQIESFKNYNQLKFEESLSPLGIVRMFYQTLTFSKYTINVSYAIGSTSMNISTTEAFNIINLEGNLTGKYLMKNVMGLK